MATLPVQVEAALRTSNAVELLKQPAIDAPSKFDRLELRRGFPASKGSEDQQRTAYKSSMRLCAEWWLLISSHKASHESSSSKECRFTRPLNGKEKYFLDW